MQKVQLERRWHGLEGSLELDRGLHLAKMRDFRLCILLCFLALNIYPINILAWWDVMWMFPDFYCLFFVTCVA